MNYLMLPTSGSAVSRHGTRSAHKYKSCYSIHFCVHTKFEKDQENFSTIRGQKVAHLMNMLIHKYYSNLQRTLSISWASLSTIENSSNTIYVSVSMKLIEFA
ncbi:hypothetical protein Droror1_Dr00027995 [Drosera rotundifolia]